MKRPGDPGYEPWNPQHQPPKPPPVLDPDTVPRGGRPLTPDEALAQGRPTKPSSEILDNVMKQPDQPGGSGGSRGIDDPRGFFPDAEGRGAYMDAEGRVLVDDRHIGNYDPKTGTAKNLNNEPIKIAVDGKQRPQGYIEQPNLPDMPEGMSPAYNARGELAGYVDEFGRADIGGKRVPVAFDAEGKLVPHDAPRRSSPPQEFLPREDLRGQTRLPGDVEPATGSLAESPADMPATGQIEAAPTAPDAPIDYSPYGKPIYGSDGTPPVGPRDIDTTPKIPVLDENGRVSHLVEPGPREIRYDTDGTPVFVQRQHPPQPATMRDRDLGTGLPFPGARQMPAPEAWAAVTSEFPLSGTGAPPRAPDVIAPTPPGGDPT